jgi:hypothetical protein
MLTLQSYLEDIRKDKTKGWSRVYRDILGQPLYDKDRFLNAVELYGEVVIFEAMVATAAKRLKNDPMNYFMTVADQRWREEIKNQAESDKETIRAHRVIEQSKEAGISLAEKIERARRRNNDTNNPPE